MKFIENVLCTKQGRIPVSQQTKGGKYPIKKNVGKMWKMTWKAGVLINNDLSKLLLD